MRLRELRTAGFRNLAPGELDVDAPLVVFEGRNGEGKTNWLEAVGVLGTLRSFRTSKPGEMVAWGGSRAEVAAVGTAEGLTRTWRWSFDGDRALRRDERAVDSVTWLTGLRATWFVPGDVALVRGEPALRRSLLDRAVLNVRPAYLPLVRDLRRVLDHKGAALRAGAGDTELDVLDVQLAALAVAVTAARAGTVERMIAPFHAHYDAIAGGEPSNVRYRRWLDGDGEWAAAWFAAHRADERRAGRVLGGPQRDDLEFTVHGRASRLYASQGQARSLVLAWKLAELDAARTEGETPLFLLDDLGSELDAERTARLVDRVRRLGAQVFVTTTDRRTVPDPTAKVIRVEGGTAMRSP